MKSQFKKVFFGLFFLFSFQFNHSFAQISHADFQSLHHYEDSLRILNDTILDGSDQNIRLHACFDFIRMMVKALKEENSFDYRFDSLKRISILYADDHSFRILNWMLPLIGGSERFYGVIQMNNKTKTILYPFFDYSDNIKNIKDTVTNNEKWFGALYYKMMEVKSPTKTYYTLFGWNGTNPGSNKKLIEVLSFDKEGKPVFGAPVFQFGKNQYPNNTKRFIIEYKEDARVSLNYDDDLQMIIFDHLVPEKPNQEGMYEHYVPDGSYEGFQWKNGKWNYVENVFTSTLKEVPVPKPLDFDKEKNPAQPK